MSFATRKSHAATLAALLLAVALAALAPGGAAGEIKKNMTMCPGQKLCAWFQSTVTPPAGWIEDKEAGEQNRVTMLTPDKPELSESDPLIYVQTSLLPGAETLDAVIASNQALWRKKEPKGSITPAGAAPRADGKEPFKLFLYENPSRPQQAFETIGYAFETLPNGERHFLTVVDTASNKAAIEASREAFLAVMKGL
jgi:hypothetical protein